MTMAQASKDDQLLETALGLFATHGYHAVGVDRIKDAAGVAKMTLYKHFPTKDILIERVLQRRDEHMRASLLAAVEAARARESGGEKGGERGGEKARAKGALAQLRAVFEWHRQWFAQPDFHGCMFIKASEEFLDDASAIREAARLHKRWLQDLMAGVLRQAGVRQHAALAAHLLVVLDGLIVNANLFRGQDQVGASWKLVQSLLAPHLPARPAALGRG